MKILLVARKCLIEARRELQLLALELFLPIIFLGIIAASYSTPLQAAYPILVNDPSHSHNALIEAWQHAQYASGQPMFKVRLMENTQLAENALKNKSAVMLVTITDQLGVPNLNLRGDALNMQYFRASVILTSLARQYQDKKESRPELFQLTEVGLNAAQGTGGAQTTFDLYAPGIIVFAILMIIPQTAMLVSREIRWKTLRRLRLTRITAFDLLSGISLSQFIVAFIQVLVVFGAAVWMGFNNQGSFWLASLIGMTLAIAAIGMGLLVACFIENDSQAANVGATISMVQVFLSGAFYQLPPLTVFNLAGHAIDVFDIFPATHSFLALQQVLTYGNSLPQVAFRIIASLLLSVFYFVLGVVIFQKKQMSEN